MFELHFDPRAFPFCESSSSRATANQATGVGQFLMTASSRASNRPGTYTKAVSPFTASSSCTSRPSPITHRSPIEVTSFSTQATPEYEDYFAVDFPAPVYIYIHVCVCVRVYILPLTLDVCMCVLNTHIYICVCVCVCVRTR